MRKGLAASQAGKPVSRARQLDGQAGSVRDGLRRRGAEAVRASVTPIRARAICRAHSPPSAFRAERIPPNRPEVTWKSVPPPAFRSTRGRVFPLERGKGALPRKASERFGTLFHLGRGERDPPPPGESTVERFSTPIRAPRRRNLRARSRRCSFRERSSARLSSGGRTDAVGIGPRSRDGTHFGVEFRTLES